MHTRRRAWILVPALSFSFFLLTACCYLSIWPLSSNNNNILGTMAGGINHSNTCVQRKADIAIIGGGLAGLTASIEASALNPSLKIVLIEKESKLGGNSAKASSGINAALSQDDAPIFEQDTLRSGAGLSKKQLVDVFVQNSPDALAFLEKCHVDLSVVSQLGGHSAKRTHRNAQGPNVGFAIVSALQNKIAETSHEWTNIDVVTGASAEQVLYADGKVTGLVVERIVRTGEAEGEGEPLRETIETPVVILATGGYSANMELLKKFAPGVESFPTTNGPWARGDGIALAQQLDADLVLMDKVQLHPTAFINPNDRSAKQKFLAPEAIRGSGALLINALGKRFVNELSTRDKVADAILQQPSQDAFMLLFDGAKDMEASLGFYKHIGLVRVVHSVEEAAAHCHVDAFVLQQELNAYAEVSHSQQPDAFGKAVFPYPINHIEDVTTPVEIHVMEVAPAVHYTMGTFPRCMLVATALRLL